MFHNHPLDGGGGGLIHAGSYTNIPLGGYACINNGYIKIVIKIIIYTFAIIIML